jgi:4-hydroxybenzoate polyprenyltransferase
MPKRLLAFRPVNLLFIALTQYLLFFHFFFPLFRSIGATMALEGARAFVFLLVTTLLAASAYLINDLYDIDADRINKGGGWAAAHPAQARGWAAGILFLGGLLAAWLAWDIRQPALWFIYPAVAFLLWVYSRYLKGMPLAGNLLVALLCMLVGGMVWFAEREAFSLLWHGRPQLALYALRALGFYLFFSFLATLFREIVKDCQDVEGDAAAGLQTLPARYGLDAARRWALAAGAALGLALLALSAWFFQSGQWGALVYVLTALATPLGPSLFFLLRAKSASDFEKVSRLAKWIIFAGVFLILFFQAP